LTVVIAARNEEESIARAISSLRAQDYPGLEIVAADDRSSDGTGSMLDRMAAEDPRVRVVHVAALPEGWLGKVYALECATSIARGEWLLFTDADVEFRPGALRRAVSHAVGLGLDHLVVAPDVHAPSTLQQAANAAFAAAFLAGTRALDVSRPGSRAYVGVGGFNLVRRALWERTPGFPFLRMEVLDDVGLARLMRDAGARRDLLFGFEDVRVQWYGSLRAMVRGLEKNFFAAARFSLPRAIALASGTAVFAIAPVIGLFAGPWWVRAAGAVAIAAHVLAATAVARRFERPIPSLLLVPAGALVLAYALLRSAWVCTRDGGITWRGTHYPLRALREGRRVDL
jgi:glycosyltransferase involved in cell wall biosynthesis